MQNCKNCFYQFTWKKIFKSIFFGYSPIECPKCGEKYYINFLTRIGYALLAVVIPIALWSRYINSITSYYYILAFLTWGVLVTAITPFFAKYHRKL